MSYQQKKIIVIPIDNRPVTYKFPQLIASVAGVSLTVPPFHLMGSLQGPTRIAELSNWFADTLANSETDAVAICLDSLTYGGLVASRRSSDSVDMVLQRLKDVPEWKHLNGKSPVVFAQSSIMRISNNDCNNAEKPYWSQYGCEIFRWSQLLHQKQKAILEIESKLKEVESKIDPDVRKDYLSTRERNFSVNLKLLEYVQSKAIDFLIFSQDDTGEFGLNVLEKEELLDRSMSLGLHNVMAYSGTDEVLMSLIARWLVLSSERRPRISLQFSPKEGRTVRSNYEGKTLEKSVMDQLKAAALDILETPSNLEDFAVVIHTAGHVQGDHIWLPGQPDLRALNTNNIVEQTMQLLEKTTVPTIICDVAYTNGSDPQLLTRLIEKKDLVKKLWGYAGWNTTGNTVGSALALGVARWHAEQHALDTREAFNWAMFTRFADDWAYQTQVRPKLTGQLSEELLNQLMMPFVHQLSTLFGLQPKNVRLSFPWQRTFEVDICTDV